MRQTYLILKLQTFLIRSTNLQNICNNRVTILTATFYSISASVSLIFLHVCYIVFESLCEIERIIFSISILISPAFWSTVSHKTFSSTMFHTYSKVFNLQWYGGGLNTSCFFKPVYFVCRKYFPKTNYF